MASDLPPGHVVDLGDLGMIGVRDLGPRDRPVVFLLHGWTATADLNWHRCYDTLRRDYRVVAFDHRGHGRGIRTRKSFRLEDCADDVVAVADALGIDNFSAVGYSMGGPIAQLLWRRHADRIDSLVLCATAPIFTGKPVEKWSFLGLTGFAALARVTPENAREWLTGRLYLSRRMSDWEPWAIQAAASHDWRMLLEAGKAIGNFSSVDWIGSVDVPVSLVVTMRDGVVSRQRQTRLFELIEHAEVFRVDGDHDSAMAVPEFVPALQRALDAAHENIDIATENSATDDTSDPAAT